MKANPAAAILPRPQYFESNAVELKDADFWAGRKNASPLEYKRSTGTLRERTSEPPSSLLNHLGFEALYCFHLLLKVTRGVYLQTDTKTVSPLVGGYLVVDVGLAGELRVGAA
jgi:hypothetical protein